jgi:predicted subunit of tRNA(5-methylaminomethyl-2-thiouridylate) methyltransferase
MDAGVLYSGGKDSTLAALLLEPFGDVTLLCCTFDVTDDHEHAQEAAREVGFPTRRVDLDPEVGREAADQIVEDGFPRNGIQTAHEHALERAAELEFDAIADGIRRDDRVPTVPRPLAQSIEDRHGVSHLAPLAGIGRDAIDEMVEASLRTERGPSAEIPKGDYETELRALIAAEHGSETVENLFPEHTQSRVLGRRENMKPDRRP